MPASASRQSRSVIEQAVEQPEDQHKADRHDDLQALLGLLQVAELAGPNQPVAGRQLDVLGDALLRLGHGAAEVAAAHAEFDGDEALHALVVNPRRAGIQGDGRQFAQRDVGIGAAGGLVGHLDVADLIDAVAIFRRITDDKIELPIAFQHRRCHRPAHRRLDDRVHVAGIEAVTRRLGAIHLDVQVRLAQHRENAKVGNAAHLAHLVADLLGQLRQDFEVRSDDLDRVGAL